MDNTKSWPELHEAEVVLEADSNPLFRQVHPNWIRDGKVTSQAFKPTSKDEGQLSTRQSKVLSAEQAFDAHRSQGLDSVGSYQVTTAEIDYAGLRSVDDSQLAAAPDGHAYIDCRDQSNGAIEKAAKKLRTCAMNHGCQHPAT